MPLKDPEAMRQYQRQWLRRRREWYFEGARCVYCAAAKDLEVNHVVPLAVEPRRMKHRIWSYRREVIEDELSRCEPVCRRCNQAHALATGVGRPGAKLSEDDAQEIRALQDTVPTEELALRYGVRAQAVQDVVAYRTFKPHNLRERLQDERGWTVGEAA